MDQGLLEEVDTAGGSAADGGEHLDDSFRMLAFRGFWFLKLDLVFVSRVQSVTKERMNGIEIQSKCNCG